MTINKPEFKAHEDFIFGLKKVRENTREEFIKYVRNTNDRMRELSQVIQQYTQTINEWDVRQNEIEENEQFREFAESERVFAEQERQYSEIERERLISGLNGYKLVVISQEEYNQTDKDTETIYLVGGS